MVSVHQSKECLGAAQQGAGRWGLQRLANMKSHTAQLTAPPTHAHAPQWLNPTRYHLWRHTYHATNHVGDWRCHHCMTVVLLTMTLSDERKTADTQPHQRPTCASPSQRRVSWPVTKVEQHPSWLLSSNNGDATAAVMMLGNHSGAMAVQHSQVHKHNLCTTAQSCP
jgi:hypothetical protein